MKPPLFRYAAVRTVEEAIETLASNPGAVVLAGGQSLIPAMNMRLAGPEMLVDIQHVSSLRRLAVEDGWIVVGAIASVPEAKSNSARSIETCCAGSN